MTEVRFELLLGRRVMTGNSRRAVGRIEEAVLERHGDEWVVTEFRVGSRALAERLDIPPFSALLPRGQSYRVKWSQLDLSNPQKPKLTVPQEELEEWE
jgi:hypothetical protein